jgi:WD40 repeat protein
MTRVFLSYARGDEGEPFDPATSFVARLHRDLTAAGLDVWFDRASMPSRTLTFHQEIRDAVAACSRLVLVVGPKAAESLHVRQEWQFAYFEAEKIVTPILRRGDYSSVPDELKLLHCEDFRDDDRYGFHLKNLIRQLEEAAPALGKLIGVPSLPPHFLSRTDRLTALRDALRVDLDRPVVITGAAARVGMHGMGGIGKSVLAATLARDRKVREAFPDGIIWVGLGPLPAVADLQRRVHKDLGGDGAFQTEHEGRVNLRDILKEKRVLLILDDVWRCEDVDWFDVLGARCRAMITTRDAGLLTSLGGVHHQVELLTDAESLNLLAQAAGIERGALPSETADLITECGRLPLAVALCGGLIRHGFAWANVLDQLRNSRIDRINDPHAARAEHKSVWNAIHVSVGFLSAAEQARFLELAVFPPDVATPLAALRTLWSHTAGFDDWDTEELVIKLSQRSLVVLATSAHGRAISLHDLVYDYVHHATDDETALHHRLLEAYRRKCPDGWHVEPPNDGYFFTHLRHHLNKAGRVGELADLLQELLWLEAKNEAGLTFDLTADFDAALFALPQSDARRRNLRLLDEALRRDIHFIARHAQQYPQVLFQCVWNSGWWYDSPEAAAHYEPLPDSKDKVTVSSAQSGSKFNRLLEDWRATKEAATPGFRWVRSMRPPLIPLGGPLRTVIPAHLKPGGMVGALPDGEQIVSCGYGISYWDARTGAKIHGIEDSAHRHALSFNRRWLVFREPRGDLTTWDVTMKRVSGLVHARYFESYALEELAISSDGQSVAAGYSTDAVRLWDISQSQWDPVWEYLSASSSRPTSRRWIRGLSFSPDDRVLAVSGFGPVRLLDSRSGEELCSVGDHHRVGVRVAFSPDGGRLATAGYDEIVRVWDTRDGKELLNLSSRFHRVHGIRFSPDGHSLAAAGSDSPKLAGAGSDGTVRIWDTRTGEERAALKGHEDEVLSLDFFPDGESVVSSSSDGTVRVWDWREAAVTPVARWRDQLVLMLAASPDGRSIATGMTNGTVILWDVATGTASLVLGGHTDDVNVVRFSPDGRILLSGSSDCTVRIWDVATGTQIRLFEGDPGGVESAIWLSDCRRCAACGHRGALQVWDIEEQKEILAVRDHGRLSCMIASLDGRTLVTGTAFTNFMARCWDLVSGKEFLRVPAVCNSMALTEDGRWLAVGTAKEGADKGKVQIWDLARREQSLEIAAHDKNVADLAFSADGRYLLSQGGENTTRFWDRLTGECIRHFDTVGDLRAMADGLAHPQVQALVTEDGMAFCTRDGIPVAWFARHVEPVKLPNSLTWAGLVYWQAWLVRLEGTQ